MKLSLFNQLSCSSEHFKRCHLYEREEEHVEPLKVLQNTSLRKTKGEDFPCGLDSKVSAYNVGDPGLILWRRKWQPTPVLLPGKSRGWRSVVGYSPWGRKELDPTEGLHFSSKVFQPHNTQRTGQTVVVSGECGSH